MIRQLSPIEPRLENCGLQFGDDTTGLYLRCEAALSLLMAIQALMPDPIEDANDFVAWFTLKQVADIIEAAGIAPLQSLGAPRMKPATIDTAKRKQKKSA